MRPKMTLCPAAIVAEAVQAHTTRKGSQAARAGERAKIFFLSREHANAARDKTWPPLRPCSGIIAHGGKTKPVQWHYCAWRGSKAGLIKALLRLFCESSC